MSIRLVPNNGSACRCQEVSHPASPPSFQLCPTECETDWLGKTTAPGNKARTKPQSNCKLAGRNFDVTTIYGKFTSWGAITVKAYTWLGL